MSLTIVPKVGQQSISKENIIFGSSGASSDLTFVVGGSSLTSIGSIATSEADFFTQTTLVNISNNQGNFGHINLVDPSSSLCELATALLQELKLPLSQDIASNLMQGIEEATNNFQSDSMTADTFEALAILYRAGARHHTKVNMPTATIIDNTPIIEERKQEDQKDIIAIETELHSMSQPIKPEPDWLKPKIFTSGSDK